MFSKHAVANLRLEVLVKRNFEYRSINTGYDKCLCGCSNDSQCI